MDRIYPTATLRHLAQRKRLTHTLAVVKLSTDFHQALLRKLLSATHGLSTSEIAPDLVTTLLTHYLAQTESAGQRIALPFAFVQAINFELTYGCNLACSHCLQDGLRPNTNQWLSTNAVIQALKDAQWLALTTLGVNFTGGEIFTSGSPILELLSAAQEIGILARANTNATWGGCRRIKIGSHEFASDEDVVAALSQRQLGRLALSLDNRYDQ